MLAWSCAHPRSSISSTRRRPATRSPIAVADQGAYLARAHDLIAALEAAGAEPRVWGRFDDGAHQITVRYRAIAEPIVAAFTA